MSRFATKKQTGGNLEAIGGVGRNVIVLQGKWSWTLKKTHRFHTHFSGSCTSATT